MKKVFLVMLATAVILLLAFFVSRTFEARYASSLFRKVNDAGGNGVDGNAIVRQDGMPGCDGGTNPSADGKFYIPGTGRECNPSEGDRKKAR